MFLYFVSLTLYINQIIYTMRWLRKYIRSKMHPVDADDAREWKGVFSVLYGIMAWNLFGFLAYTWMKDKLPRNQDSSVFNVLRIIVKNILVINLQIIFSRCRLCKIIGNKREQSDQIFWFPKSGRV